MKAETPSSSLNSLQRIQHVAHSRWVLNNEVEKWGHHGCFSHSRGCPTGLWIVLRLLFSFLRSSPQNFQTYYRMISPQHIMVRPSPLPCTLKRGWADASNNTDHLIKSNRRRNNKGGWLAKCHVLLCDFTWRSNDHLPGLNTSCSQKDQVVDTIIQIFQTGSLTGQWKPLLTQILDSN